MKFLEHETLNHEDAITNRIYVFGGNKKSHLGFFNEEGQFWAFDKKRMLKLSSESVHLLELTPFSKEQYKHASTVFSKEVFEKMKEALMLKRAKYTAAILTKKSAKKLLSIVHEKIPEGWTINAHHMTINLGEAMSEVQHLMGKKVTLNVTGYGYSEEYQVIAMLVETEVFSQNEIKHITVALNKAEGAQAFHSNKIESFAHIEPFTLEAIVDVVLENGETRHGTEQFLQKQE